MPKLPILSGAKVCAILERHSFKRMRQKGSHVTMQKIVTVGSADGDEVEETLTVIVPMHDELKIGTLSSIIRQSGLGRAAFE
jgi:predicted RNA binding protein YcfA (HicA-like mRNA interferase family)